MIYKELNNEILFLNYDTIKSFHLNFNSQNINNNINLISINNLKDNEYINSLKHLFYSNKSIYNNIFENIVKLNFDNITKLLLINISNKIYKEKIIPNSFYISFNNNLIQDDGNNNLLLGENIIGNIFYDCGIIVINNSELNITNENCDFIGFSYLENVQEIHIFIYINGNEINFNYSLNPTFNKLIERLKEQDIELLNNINTYFTTIGLYNNDDELIAVAKTINPIKISNKNGFIIKLILRLK